MGIDTYNKLEPIFKEKDPVVRYFPAHYLAYQPPLKETLSKLEGKIKKCMKSLCVLYIDIIILSGDF